jgi:hypothetical protein
MDLIIRALIERLAAKGMELSSIPAFIRNLANALAAHPQMSLPELNRRLHMLGWNDIELDVYTLQLVLSSFDSGLDYPPDISFVSTLSPVAVHAPEGA